MCCARASSAAREAFGLERGHSGDVLEYSVAGGRPRRKVDHEEYADGAWALGELCQRGCFSASGRSFENDATTLRQCLIDLLKREHLGRLRAVRIKPDCGEID